MDSLSAINLISNVITLMTFGTSSYVAYALWKRGRDARERAREQTPSTEDYGSRVKTHEGVKSANPMALAISLIPKSATIKGQVETFLAAKGWKMKMEELNMDGINNSSDLQQFLWSLREKRRLLDELQATEVHLFYAGPVAGAILLGAMFDHWVPVKIYHKPTPPPPEIYEYWMPLMK
jgi:SMODS-associated and fused to various effectors sensor domain